MALFRREAQEANRPRLHGEIVVRSAWVWWALTVGVVLFVLCMLALIFWGEYTRRVAVSGYLIPVAGVVRIHSLQAGRAALVHVTEGQTVTSGQALVTVVDERPDAHGYDSRSQGVAQIQARQNNLKNVMQQQRELFVQTRDGLVRRTGTLQQEMAQLQSEQQTQTTRVAYAKTTHARYLELLKQNYVSQNAVQEKLETVIDHEARLQTMQRAYTGLRRELETLQAEMATLPMRESTQVSDLQRNVGIAQQELIELDARRELVVTSPQAGRVSGLTVKQSQVVNPERPLMMLLPQAVGSESELEAHLFAQSKDAGFVKAGQVVLVRYSAYPYQKFGHYKGVVTEVSRTPLMPSELPFPVATKTDASAVAGLGGLGALAGAASSSEPVFRIRVKLADQTARAYGAAQPLQSGMQLEADIMLDTRTVFEWIMEPVYSLRGKYFQ